MPNCFSRPTGRTLSLDQDEKAMARVEEENPKQ
jgi:hypothetical protein